MPVRALLRSPDLAWTLARPRPQRVPAGTPGSGFRVWWQPDSSWARTLFCAPACGT
jgi:hypothetical protein